MSLAFLGAYFWLPLFAGEAVSPETPATSAAHGHGGEFKFFEPLLNHEKYNALERTGLIAVLIIAIVGLLYALMLRFQVLRAPKGTPKMQEIADAVREGANAYLGAQFRKIGPLIVIITVALWFTKYQDPVFAWGRAGAFLVGALFSWCVGFVGMRLATAGNLRVATAARSSYGEAMQLGYRTGTVAGMLTDGLGLLGGTVHLSDLRRSSLRSVAGLRLRRHAAGLVHAGRRRYLHQGSRRRCGPGG